MMSLSSHRDATATSDQPTEPRRVRPGPETPALCGFFSCPDLLERRPVVRRSLRRQEPGRVGLLEAEIHLEAPVVRAAAVRPAPLVVVDTEKCRLVWRMLGPPPRLGGKALPQADGPLDVGDAHRAELPP